MIDGILSLPFSPSRAGGRGWGTPNHRWSRWWSCSRYYAMKWSPIRP